MRWLGAVKDLLSGRWQIPAGIAAIMLASVALLRMKPPPRHVDFDAILADITALQEARHYHDAINAAANLLDLKPPLSKEHRSILNVRLMRMLHEMESRRDKPLAANGKLLLEHREAAMKLGWKPGADDELIAAAASEWTDDPAHALELYESALSMSPAPQTRYTALRALVRLLEKDRKNGSKRQEYLEELLSQEGVAPGYAWWTLQRAVQAQLDRGDIAAARELLPKYGKRFERSDLRGYHDFILAWLDVHEGKLEEALPLVEQIDQWLLENTVDDIELHKAGFLPARNRVLRGLIEVGEFRPQDALGSFDQAQRLDPAGQTRVEATVGRAAALALLERHEAGRAELRELVRLARGDEALASNLWRVRDAVNKLFESQHDRGNRDDAIAYLDLALELTPKADHAARRDLLERLGREHQSAAKTSDDGGSTEHTHKAAQCYEAAADLVDTDLPKLSNLLWAAAEEYDRVGRGGDARRVLERFVGTFGSDARLPRALLQLGQTCAAMSDLDAAIKWYRTLLAQFGKLEEGARARLAIADCLLLKGERFEPEAELYLNELLSDDGLSPQAQVYRDALFALCDLLLRQQRYAEAISHTEDFLAFYPVDPERDTLRFLLADAYRRSAIALRDHPPEGASLEASHGESQARFRRAATLFGEFANRPAADADSASSVTYQRLALFYQADCLYETNDGESLEAALSTYRLAAARYQAEPAALVAQVQIANILLRQGKSNEAARAIERARWMLRGIPDRDFDDAADGLDRAGWTRYLDTIASSHLLRDAFQATQ